MSTKKRFFTRNKKSVYKSPQDRTSQRTSLGNKSVNTRESIRLAKLAKNKKEAKKVLTVAKKENSLKTSQFPNISQTITENVGKIKKTIHSGLPLSKLILACFFVLIGMVSLWQGFLLIQKGLQLQAVVAKRLQLGQDLGLWEGITQKYPTYRDAYFQASVLAYRLGESTKEQVLLDKTLQLDPNYAPAQNLEKISH